MWLANSGDENDSFELVSWVEDDACVHLVEPGGIYLAPTDSASTVTSGLSLRIFVTSADNGMANNSSHVVLSVLIKAV